MMAKRNPLRSLWSARVAVLLIVPLLAAQPVSAADSGASDSAPLPPDNDQIDFGRGLIPDLVADSSVVEIDGAFYCYATPDGWELGLATSGPPVVLNPETRTD
jgi:hypothetical protein